MGQSARGGAAGASSDLQKPGFGLEVRAARLPRRLNGFESCQEGVLGEILALVPIAREPVDHLEHQSAILVNERLDRLGRRLGIGTHGIALPL